jgi:hypothetical protein
MKKKKKKKKKTTTEYTYEMIKLSDERKEQSSVQEN